MPCKNFVSLLTVILAIAAGVTPSIVRQTIEYNIPADSSGSQLDLSAGLGEPLNVCCCSSECQERSNFQTSRELDHYFRFVLSNSPYHVRNRIMGKVGPV